MSQELEIRRRINKQRLLEAFRRSKVQGPKFIQILPELWSAWLEHIRLRPRPAELHDLRLSNKIMAHLMEEQERAKQIEYDLCIQAPYIRNLKKNDFTNPKKNVELMVEKEIVQDD